MEDELLDIVDQDDEVIGHKLRSEVYAQHLSNFRVVYAFLLNDNGQLWIPRRTQFKSKFPLCIDASMGGHVAAGETYKEALKRELMEELCLDVNSMTYDFLGALNPLQHSTSSFMHVYLLRSNNAPNYNRDDFVEYFWLSPQELLDRIGAGEQCKYDLPIIVKKLILNK